MTDPDPMQGARRALIWVVALNLGYGVIEGVVGLMIGSVSLIVDSVDFFEDSFVNLLILIGLGWSMAARARLGGALAFFLAIPAAAALWMVWSKIQTPVPPAADGLTLTALGALAINFASALIIARYRNAGGALMRAAFLSARNDMIGNMAMIGAGALTAATGSIWPDILVGLGLAMLHGDAAREVWRTARDERLAQRAPQP